MRRHPSDTYRANNPGPREREALQWIADHPGATAVELREAMGWSRGRVVQVLERLERPMVRRSAVDDRRRHD